MKNSVFLNSNHNSLEAFDPKRIVFKGIDANSIFKILASLGIKRGDDLLLHSELMGFGLPVGFSSKEEYAQIFISILQNLIGPEGTLVVPCFNYDFCQTGEYNPFTSRPQIGLIPEAFFGLKGVYRSLNPVFSYCAMGPKAETLLESDIERCFGPESINKKLLFSDMKFVFLGAQGLQMITCIHAAEYEARVPHRYVKKFSGHLILGGNERKALDLEYFVRDLALNYTPNFKRLEDEMKQKSLLRVQELGWGTVSCCNARDLKDLALKRLAVDPYDLVQK